MINSFAADELLSITLRLLIQQTHGNVERRLSSSLTLYCFHFFDPVECEVSVILVWILSGVVRNFFPGFQLYWISFWNCRGRARLAVYNRRLNGKSFLEEFRRFEEFLMGDRKQRSPLFVCGLESSLLSDRAINVVNQSTSPCLEGLNLVPDCRRQWLQYGIIVTFFDQIAICFKSILLCIQILSQYLQCYPICSSPQRVVKQHVADVRLHWRRVNRRDSCRSTG